MNMEQPNVGADDPGPSTQPVEPTQQAPEKVGRGRPKKNQEDEEQAGPSSYDMALLTKRRNVPVSEQFLLDYIPEIRERYIMSLARRYTHNF